jgi:hypothetical protein
MNCSEAICIEHKMCLLPNYHKLIRELQDRAISQGFEDQSTDR